MRMLLIFTAGVALMSAPALAQTDNQQDNPQAGMPTAPANPDVSQPAPPPTGAEPGVTQQAPSDQQMQPSGQAQEPGVTAPSQTQSNSRLYQSSGQQLNGQNIQIITNGPVPDNKANRAKYRPLSHLGRETRARGN